MSENKAEFDELSKWDECPKCGDTGPAPLRHFDDCPIRASNSRTEGTLPSMVPGPYYHDKYKRKL